MHDHPADLTRFVHYRDEAGRLSLRDSHRPAYGAICADWSTADLRRRVAAGRRQPLARALGLHRRADLTLVDATGGLGRDAYVLAALGARLTLIERHPVVFELLADARARAVTSGDAAADRITLLHADATLALCDWRAGVDAIFLDPMYPDDGKSALPSKEMQLLRDLTGGDADGDALLAAARAAAPRVAVKRPRHAPPLADLAPDLRYDSTQLRLDVYLRRDAAAAG